MNQGDSVLEAEQRHPEGNGTAEPAACHRPGARIAANAVVPTWPRREDVRMHDPVRDEIRLLQQKHADLPFPPRLRGEVVAGVNMVMVDADIAGCVQLWLGSSSNLDAPRIGVLRTCRDQVEGVLPSLTEPVEVEYTPSCST